MDTRIFEIADETLKKAAQKGCEFCDVYMETSSLTSIRFTDRKIQNFEIGASTGVGVRVLSDGITGYSYCEGFNPPDVRTAGDQAIQFAQNGQPHSLKESKNRIIQEGFPVKVPFWETGDADKIRLCFIADDAARSVHESVLQVIVVYRDWHKQFHIMNSEALHLTEETNLLEFYVFVVAGRDGRFQRSYRTCGGINGLEIVTPEIVEQKAVEAARAAVEFLDAVPAPVGKMPVAIENGKMGGGVLVHEAIGHALESDYIESGSSLYSGMLGKQIGAPIVTVVDDATLLPNTGCYYHDDEGTPAQRTVLINKGVLENYMSDLMGSKNLDIPASGNGRRQSFRFYPIPRMTCTFIDQGTTDPDDILKEIKSGLYVRALGGGHGDTSGAGFAFNVAEGFLIENGRITSPVRGATLTGKGVDVLKNVFAVGNDLAHTGVGRCGKLQSVPVSCGQPTLGIRELLIGGTQT